MKFTVDRSLFINKLNDVLKAVSSRASIPILTGIKLDLDENRLLLTGSDTDISIEAAIPTKTSEGGKNADLIFFSAGSVVVNAHFFSEIVKKLPNTTFDFEVKEGLQIQIVSGDADYTINGLDASSYPRLPEISDEASFSVRGKTLQDLINATVFAVSTQDSRPALTGVNFTFAQDHIKAVATDSHRLSQRTMATEDGPASEVSMILPGKNLQDLAQIIGESDPELKIFLGDSQVMFKIDSLNFYTRLLEGVYPDVDRLLPASSTTHVQFDIADLSSTLSRASLVTHANRNNAVQMKLDVANGQVTVSGNSPEIGKVEEKVGFANLDGRDLSISFNPDYMQAALRAARSVADAVKINFTEPLRPFTVVPAKEGVEFVQLITPIRTF